MTNPFAAFSIQVGSAGIALAASNHLGCAPPVNPSDVVHALPLHKAAPNSGKLMSIAENGAGGYQFRTVVRVLGKNVETMLDGCAGSNHVTEELVVGMLNHAKSLGISTEDPRFPIVRFEHWVHPEFVHGIAAVAQFL